MPGRWLCAAISLRAGALWPRDQDSWNRREKARLGSISGVGNGEGKKARSSRKRREHRKVCVRILQKCKKVKNWKNEKMERGQCVEGYSRGWRGEPRGSNTRGPSAIAAAVVEKRACEVGNGCQQWTLSRGGNFFTEFRRYFFTSVPPRADKIRAQQTSHANASGAEPGALVCAGVVDWQSCLLFWCACWQRGCLLASCFSGVEKCGLSNGGMYGANKKIEKEQRQGKLFF